MFGLQISTPIGPRLPTRLSAIHSLLWQNAVLEVHRHKLISSFKRRGVIACKPMLNRLRFLPSGISNSYSDRADTPEPPRGEPHPARIVACLFSAERRGS